MKTQSILYADEHDVTVTSSFLKVKKSLYQLNGITNHGLRIVRPERLPALLISILGFTLVVLGASEMFPEISILQVRLYGLVLMTNSTIGVVGCILLVVGAALAGLMREKYAVRIVTAEGEKNVVVSRNKEYITLILDALNHAFLNLVSQPDAENRLARS